MSGYLVEIWWCSFYSSSGCYQPCKIFSHTILDGLRSFRCCVNSEWFLFIGTMTDFWCAAHLK